MSRTGQTIGPKQNCGLKKEVAPCRAARSAKKTTERAAMRMNAGKCVGGCLCGYVWVHECVTASKIAIE